MQEDVNQAEDDTEVKKENQVGEADGEAEIVN